MCVCFYCVRGEYLCVFFAHGSRGFRNIVIRLSVVTRASTVRSDRYDNSYRYRFRAPARIRFDQNGFACSVYTASRSPSTLPYSRAAEGLDSLVHRRESAVRFEADRHTRRDVFNNTKRQSTFGVLSKRVFHMPARNDFVFDNVVKKTRSVHSERAVV